jgi:putative hydrolase of the HAD superfamily
VATGLPRGILFDLDDTILDDTGARDECWRRAATDVLAGSGLDAEAAGDALLRHNRAFWSDLALNRTYRLDMLGARRVIAVAALGELGLDDEAVGRTLGDRCHELRAELLAPLAGAVETVERLRRAGVALGLVTNGGGEGQRAKIERFGLAPLFGYIGIEGERGFGKPDPRAFLTALETLGLAASDAWMVGDNLTYDIAGAQAVGITAIWVNRDGGGLPGTGVVPDRVVRSIAEL